MVTVSDLLGRFEGRPIYVCTDNIKDPTKDLTDPEAMFHELLRWWVGDRTDPKTGQRDIDKWRNVPSVTKQCAQKHKWPGW
jgi:hypothetical protein